MKFTKEQRKEICASLKQAKKRVCYGYSHNNEHKLRHICFALWFTENGGELACEVIHTRLGDRQNVRDYLMYDVGVPEYQLTQENIQAFRHRWLDSLIEEFSV